MLGERRLPLRETGREAEGLGAELGPTPAPVEGSGRLRGWPGPRQVSNGGTWLLSLMLPLTTHNQTSMTVSFRA